MKVSVLVPTYRRCRDLARCLEALKQQSCHADEVLVVVRDTDDETHEFLRSFTAEALPLQVVNVWLPGQVAALNGGMAVARGDIIAITDDDAAPAPTWLEQIKGHYLSDSTVGGVGGRDWVYLGDRLLEGSENQVGILQWFGRVVGNHHIGIGEAREVDILKGANMSYRREAIEGLRFDDRLKGQGAQVHNDLAFSLSVKRRCWKLIYDPAVAVNHYPAQRFDDDQRGSFNAIATINQSHNEVLALLDYLSPLRRLIFLIWSNLIGTRTNPGLIQVLRLFPQEGWLAVQKGWSCLVGRWQGLQTWMNSHPS
ncbi:glycosyltransferase family 2 protein [Alkalinema sp. FACHB-956]|uniref:glycosyltransferase family 2 protein n=1 Tax=Alkalinema sp. FACHB-956 TaxID=2692768 RepID=UPI001684F010|nr:glycosyltransferase family 2 protein [Alkalinema sp. FACHB-956]MBD2329618.1 glycosyltransferase family 2 protein [Alkalinema sp. FACHB-956]